MNRLALARALVCTLLLSACSGAASQEVAVAAQGSGEFAEAQTDPPQASGATEYVPAKPRVPEGAIDRVLLDRVLAAGPGWLLSEVPLQPTFLAKHKFSGFKLLSVFRNDPKVLRYGILPGDIVRSVNGQKIVTPSDLLAIFERLKTSDVLEIFVQRDGVERQFRFPIVPALGLTAIAPPSDATSSISP